ncbi:MAG: hypothetical protein Q8K65_11825 [Alphaproteobacteria bacterium]|nr:hypothetical protein [Alphaproteobacteria bacterium]
MANRTGQGTNLPTLNRSSLPVAGLQPVRIAADTGSAQALFSIGGLLREMSGRIEERLDVQAEVEGRREGTLAGQQETLPQLLDDTTIRGRAFNASAKDAAITRIDMQSRLYLSEIESKNTANPGGFRAKADSYMKGVLSQLATFDPALGQRYEADFSLRADGAARRLEAQAQAVARDRMLENALRLQQAATADIAQDAAGLFDAGPENVQAGITRMMTGAVRMVDVASQIGPDGMPLFSARERLAFEQKAEAAVAEQVAMAWMGRQENVLDAWGAWKSGAATIEVADGNGGKATIPLRQLLGERGYQLAEGAFVERLRGQLALDAQIDSARDRAFKKNSDEAFADLSVLAQSGGLTLQSVEDARAQLEPDRYLTLRKVAVGGFPEVSDGATYTRLATADLDGQDIRAELREAATRLTRGDYMELHQRNYKRLERGQTDPVSEGRDFVGNSLGRLSTEIGFAQSMSIPKAEAEYAQRVQAFVQAEGRAPVLSETLEIGRDIVRRYSVMDTETALVNLPLPITMTPAQKFNRNLSAKDIETAVQRTNEMFLKKHGGDPARLEADDIYLREMQLLRDYHQLLILKEPANATR